jgi:hypothetical protein
MGVEASQIDDGDRSREGFKSSSIQMQMEEEVQKIGIIPNKVGVEKEGG